MAESLSPFVARHIGPRDHEIQKMLTTLGYSSLDQLTQTVVPAKILDNASLNVSAGASEEQALAELRSIASKNKVLKSFIGQGYYGTHTPKVILRNVLENPAWYTAYTPYQPEISQGRLEVLFYFQTMITELTGLEIANASLLDEATAAAEAMTLCHRHQKGVRNRFLVSTACHPQTIAVIQTRATPLDIEVVMFDETKTYGDWTNVFGVIVQYPATNGSVHNYEKLRSALAQLDAIAATPGVDGVFIGPQDLAADFGHLTNPSHPEVQAAIADGVARIRKAGKAAGIVMGAEADARKWLDAGCLFVAVGSDIGLLARGAEALVAKFKSAS